MLKKSKRITKKRTSEEFISLLISIYGDEYSYSKTKYVTCKDKVCITCKKHGDFFQIAECLYRARKNGCPKCSEDKRKIKPAYLTDNFIRRAREVHGDKYDYSKSIYKTNAIKMEIICPEHGSFFQHSANHVSCKKGCPKCRNEGNRKRFQMGKEKFVELASKRHSNQYDYSLVEYVNCDTSVSIICNKHKTIFKQTPYSHLRVLKQRACPSCSNGRSSQEDLIEAFLFKYNLPLIKRNKKLIPPKEVDFYIPSHKVGIECNGLFWHSEFQGNFIGKSFDYHLDKTALCKGAGVDLFHVLETDVKQNQKIVISMLKRYFKVGKIIVPEENIEIREIPQDTKSKFLNKYEINGDIKSDFNVGLFYKNRLIITAALKKYKSHKVEILRFSEIFSFTIANAFDILLKYLKEKGFKKIKIKLNNNWPRSDIVDLKHKKNNPPKAWYYKSREVATTNLISEKEFISKLTKQGKYDKLLTTAENCVKNGWNRIWDTGSTVYEKEL